jgi:hypothetical protein
MDGSTLRDLRSVEKNVKRHEHALNKPDSDTDKDGRNVEYCT